MSKRKALPIHVPSTKSVIESARTFVPRMAILIHQADGPSSGHSNKAALLTLHPITESRDGVPHIGPGTIMGEGEGRTVGNILLQSEDARTYSRTIPILSEHVLTVEPDAVTWFVPAHRALMHCLDTKGKRHALDVVWPHLILRVVRRTLYVVAVESAHRPCASTPLFAAPLTNISAGVGRMCTGSAVLPRSSSVDSIPSWDRIVTQTYNTHVNHGSTLRGGASNEQLLDFWKGRVGKRTPPSARRYTSLQMNLSQWLKQTTTEREIDP